MMLTGLNPTSGQRPKAAGVTAPVDCDSPGGLITLGDALDRLLAAAPDPGSEIIALEEAAGRRLAAPVHAIRDRPARALSAMDGYAIFGRDPPPPGRSFEIIGKAYPGAPFEGVVDAGTTVRVTTGAPIPVGAGRVVMDECVTIAGRSMTVASPPGSKLHFRAQGSDFHAGDCLVPARVTLSATTLMAAAAGEAQVVTVKRRPRIALVSTGDEIARPGQPVGDHQIPDSVSVAVAALLSAWGACIVRRDRSSDDSVSIRDVLKCAGADTDIVVVIGGASGSEKDQSRTASVALGADILFEGVALKPGKPAWAAQRDGQLLIGLPGNPWAGLVAARLLVAPVVAQMESGSADSARRWRFAPSLEPLGSGSDRDVILKAHLDPDGVRILSQQDSSSHGQLSDLNVIVRRPPACGPTPIGGDLEYLEF